MRELSLFSGIGGGLLGSILLDWHTVAAVDFEPYCCEVLARRKQDGFFKEPFDIYCMDIGEFNRRVAPIYTGQVDIITGGFPCQPFSCAGQRKGSNDKRNGFPVLAETIRIVRPRYLLLENVPALLNFEYFGEILSTLSASGYDVRWKVISAGELGAPHRRDRLWIMGHANGDNEQNKQKCKRGENQESMGKVGGVRGSSIGKAQNTGDTINIETRGAQTERKGRKNIRQGCEKGSNFGESGCGKELSHSDILGCGRGGDMERCGFDTNDQEQHPAPGESTGQGWERESGKAGDDVSDTISEGWQGRGELGDCTGKVDSTTSNSQSRKVTWWDNDPAEPLYGVESEMGRVVAGYPGRVDELKGLGNSQVPLCMATAYGILNDEDFWRC